MNRCTTGAAHNVPPSCATPDPASLALLQPCEHRWRGFAYNLSLKEDPCQCWVKVGARSLPATAANFLKPWFFIDVKRGRVAGFYFALKYVD
jgi:hypothetical protein